MCGDGWKVRLNVVGLLVFRQFLLNLAVWLFWRVIVVTFTGAQWLSDPQSTKARNTHRCIVSEATPSRSKLVLFGSVSVEGHLYIHI